MICEKCPANTYSVGGGGIRIDGTMGAFGFKGEDGNVTPLRMEASCLIHSKETKEFLKNEMCLPWSRTGTSLKAYESLVSDVLVDFDLSYPVYFDEEGSITFKYRKDSIGTAETTYGVFKFFIDGEVQMQDSDWKKNDWQVFTIDEIPRGYHSLVWRYTKLNMIPYTEFMEAEIEVSYLSARSHFPRLSSPSRCVVAIQTG